MNGYVGRCTVLESLSQDGNINITNMASDASLFITIYFNNNSLHIDNLSPKI